MAVAGELGSAACGVTFDEEYLAVFGGGLEQSVSLPGDRRRRVATCGAQCGAPSWLRVGPWAASTTFSTMSGLAGMLLG